MGPTVDYACIGKINKAKTIKISTCAHKDMFVIKMWPVVQYMREKGYGQDHKIGTCGTSTGNGGEQRVLFEPWSPFLFYINNTINLMC